MAGKMEKVLMKPLMRAVPTTVIAVVLLSILGIFLTGLESMLGPVGTVVTTLVMGVIAYLLFVFAKQMHRGNDDFVTMIPTLILVSTVAAVLSTAIPALSLSLEINTVAGIALSLTVIYIAEEYARNIVK